MEKNKVSKRRLLKLILLGTGILFVLLFILNCYVVLSVNNKIIKDKDYSKLKDIQCIIVLGAGIRKDKPSPLLQDRLDKAIELYFEGVAPKIIVSGDHGRDDHDEVNVMKNYAIEKGVKREDVFMDHAGFSTYDTMYRAKEIFGVERAVVVTQKYHIFRSVYIANHLGIDAYGVPAEDIKHQWAIYREFREVLARDKDVFKCLLKPKSKYLGEKIDITQSGDLTND